MIPGFCLTRLNQRYQEDPMTCKTPCAKCVCDAPCGHLSYDDDFPFETDKSALGTQQEKWLNSPATFLDRLCALEPDAVECRTYED